jgi:hypothetical protein
MPTRPENAKLLAAAQAGDAEKAREALQNGALTNIASEARAAGRERGLLRAARLALGRHARSHETCGCAACAAELALRHVSPGGAAAAYDQRAARGAMLRAAGAPARSVPQLGLTRRLA